MNTLPAPITIIATTSSAPIDVELAAALAACRLALEVLSQPSGTSPSREARAVQALRDVLHVTE